MITAVPRAAVAFQIPAPLVIFSTFVGYFGGSKLDVGVGGEFAGGILMTVGEVTCLSFDPLCPGLHPFRCRDRHHLLCPACLRAGMFLPAFSFTIIGHTYFERAVADQGLSAFLDGVSSRSVEPFLCASAH